MAKIIGNPTGVLNSETNPAEVKTVAEMLELAVAKNQNKVYKYVGDTSNGYIKNEYYRVVISVPTSAPNEGYPYYVIMYQPRYSQYQIIWLADATLNTYGNEEGAYVGASSSNARASVIVTGSRYQSEKYSTIDQAVVAIQNENTTYTFSSNNDAYIYLYGSASQQHVSTEYSGQLIFYSNFDGKVTYSSDDKTKNFTANPIFDTGYTMSRIFAPVLQEKTVAPKTSTQIINSDGGYDGLSSITISAVTASIDSDIKAANIKSGVNILGVEGTYTGEGATLQTKTITPTTSVQTVSPDDGYDGLSSVEVGAVTSTIDANILPENIASGVTILGVEGTFEGGGDLEEAFITRTITAYSNNTLTKIGDHAFAGCTKLESINTPNVTAIGSHSFYNCDKLTSISFPNLITIGSYAFQSCNKLTGFDIPNARSIGSYAFSSCAALTEITIPENITTLESSVFSNCTYLQSAVFLGDITQTSDSVFYECTNLKTIDFTQCTSVPTFSGSSNYYQNFVRNHSNELKIYVPVKLYSQWRTNEQWNYWAEHIYFKNIDATPIISLDGSILTMEDPSGMATGFYVRAVSDVWTYDTMVEGNTIDLLTLCEADGTYTVSVQARDINDIYGGSVFSNELQYTCVLPKLDAPEIWLENNGYNITFDNPLYDESNTMFDRANFTFYLDDVAYSGAQQLNSLRGHTFEGVKKIACVSENGEGDMQGVIVNESYDLWSYDGEYVEYELTEDVYSCYFVQHACLSADTLVTMADGSTKSLGEVEVGDMVKSWDFDNNVPINKEITSTNLSAEPKFRTAYEYYKLTFSDGTIIKHAATHRFYNVEQNAFVYTIYWNIGDHTYKEDGTLVSLVSRELIEEPMVHGMITMDDYTCYFANGLMTGDRRCPTDIVVGEATE